jgi:hypothetical protein
MIAVIVPALNSALKPLMTGLSPRETEIELIEIMTGSNCFGDCVPKAPESVRQLVR